MIYDWFLVLQLWLNDHLHPVDDGLGPVLGPQGALVQTGIPVLQTIRLLYTRSGLRTCTGASSSSPPSLRTRTVAFLRRADLTSLLLSGERLVGVPCERPGVLRAGHLLPRRDDGVELVQLAPGYPVPELV